MMFEFLNPVDTKEIIRLHEMLDNAKIPHYWGRRSNGFAVEYPNADEHMKVCDAVCMYGTYGSERGLIEIMGLLTPEEEEFDSVVGWLTADDVFDRIKNDWENGTTRSKFEDLYGEEK